MTAFKIAKAEFLRGLKLAKGIADRKATMPVLANVLLQTRGPTTVSLTASDLNISVTAELKSHNTAEGSMLVQAGNLYEVVSNAPGDEIAVEGDDKGWAHIKSAKARYKLAGLKSADFPKVPQYSGAWYATIESAVLRLLIDGTIFAVCEDQTRFNLTGVLLESDGATIRTVATDGHRLCCAAQKVSGPRLTGGVIVPRKGAAELKKLCEQGVSVKLAVDGHDLFAVQDDITIAVKLIDLVFPGYDQVIPRDHKNGFTIDRIRLLDAMRRVQMMTTEMRGVTVNVTSGGVEMSVENPDMGEVREDLEAEVAGNDVRIGFSPKYMAELLTQMTSDQVTVHIGTNLDPILVKPLSTDDYLGVVMPMRVD